MFGSTRKPGMRGSNSLTMGSLGSLSGTVFTERSLGDATPPQQTWFVVQDNTSKVNGVSMITETSGTSQTRAEVIEDLRRYGKVEPRYTVTFFASPQEQTTFINKIRSGGSGSVASAIEKFLSPSSSTSSVGLPTRTKVAIGAAALVGAYLLWGRK